MLTIFEDTVLVFSSVVTSPVSSATSSSRKVLFSLRLREQSKKEVHGCKGHEQKNVSGTTSVSCSGGVVRRDGPFCGDCHGVARVG